MFFSYRKNGDYKVERGGEGIQDIREGRAGEMKSDPELTWKGTTLKQRNLMRPTMKTKYQTAFCGINTDMSNDKGLSIF